VIFFEHRRPLSDQGEVPDGEIVDTLGTAKIVRRPRRQHPGAGPDNCRAP
jgi:pyruvate dehydrogenase E1 component beta subunit